MKVAKAKQTKILFILAEFSKEFTEKHYPGLGFKLFFVSETKPL